MKYVFRCDSSYIIGSGHIMRCISLAKLLNGEIHFICKKLPSNINSHIINNQFLLHEVEDSDTIFSELEIVSEIILKINPDVLIVDHYSLGLSWEEYFSQRVKKLLIIDDIARQHIDTKNSAILDQNFRTKVPLEYKKKQSTMFLGPSYCLLAEKFRLVLGESLVFNDKVLDVMIFFGGSDSHSQTLRLAKIISKFSESINWTLVCGAQNQDLRSINKAVDSLKNARTLVNIQNMHEVMMNSDLFIGAGGTTTWERLKMALPSICISVASNQVVLSHELETAGVISYLGPHDNVSDREIIHRVKEVIESPHTRKRMVEKGLDMNVGSKLIDVINYLKF